MVDNVFLAEIAQPIAKWELTYVPMLKKAKTLYDQAVLDVEFAVLFAQEAF